MKLLAKLQRPEYHAQPLQILRRLWRVLTLTSRRSRAVITLPWKLPIVVNPREVIGSSIVALNSLDLPTTETLWRLLDDRAVCADVGANIGYMTSAMAARLSGGGCVHSFEPLPDVADALELNIAAWRPRTTAELVVHRVAAGDHAGRAFLHFPPAFAGNRGTASLVAPAAGHAVRPPMAVECARLDQRLGGYPLVDLIKVDVEGHELAVFRGAGKLLDDGRVRDVVFEEHDPAGGVAADYLRARGYTIFRVARRYAGPELVAPTTLLPDELDPATYLGTRDPVRARQRFAPRGWTVFSGSTKRSTG